MPVVVLAAGCSAGSTSSPSTYRAVATSQAAYEGVYAQGGPGRIKAAYLRGTTSGGTATGTLVLGPRSVLSEDTGLTAGGFYTVEVTFSGSAVRLIINGAQGFHDSPRPQPERCRSR